MHAALPSMAPPNATTDALQRLPHPLQSLIFQFLDARSRKRLAYAAPRDAIFRQALRVCIPPDAVLREPVIERLAAASLPLSSSSMDARQSRFTVVDDDLFPYLAPIADQVRNLKLTTSKYQWSREKLLDAETWPRLQSFPHLVSLHIDGFHYPDEIDLALLSRCLPQLQALSVHDIHCIKNRLQPLPDLHTLKLINTNINSLTVVVGFPKSSSLSLRLPGTNTRFQDFHCLDMLVAPLQRLELGGCWIDDPTPAILRHAPTLVRLRISDTRFDDLVSRPRYPVSFPMLRSLEVGQFNHIDLQPLTVLVSLEELKINMHVDATTCQPLQQLRKLHITRGWLRDIIGMIPSLQQLEAHDYGGLGTPHKRAVLDLPRGGKVNSIDCDLRELTLGGRFNAVVSEDLLTCLQRVERLKYVWVDSPAKLIPVIQQLPRLKSIHMKLRLGVGTIKLTQDTPIASVHCLEEVNAPLWVEPGIPAWMEAAPKLHKLHLGPKTASLAHCPPGVTHLYASAVVNAAIVRQMLRFKHLRVVSIPKKADCLVLRRERRVDGALPLLQCIQHPVYDCLAVSSSSTMPHSWGKSTNLSST